MSTHKKNIRQQSSKYFTTSKVPLIGGLQLNLAPPHAPFSLQALYGTDQASNLDDRRSTFGAIIFLGPNLVSWWSKKQIVVACFSNKDKYISLAHATMKVTQVQTLLSNLHIKHIVPTVLCNILNTISLAHNHVLHARTKHMILELFFVREKVVVNQLKVLHVKALSLSQFCILRSKLKVRNALPPS